METKKIRKNSMYGKIGKNNHDVVAGAFRDWMGKPGRSDPLSIGKVMTAYQAFARVIKPGEVGEFGASPESTIGYMLRNIEELSKRLLAAKVARRTVAIYATRFKVMAGRFAIAMNSTVGEPVAMPGSPTKVAFDIETTPPVDMKRVRAIWEEEADNKLRFAPVRGEHRRTYHFPKGTVTILDVMQICVRPSGTHRLETKSGQKHIIAAGWLSIEIVAERWSL